VDRRRARSPRLCFRVDRTGHQLAIVSRRRAAPSNVPSTAPRRNGSPLLFSPDRTQVSWPRWTSMCLATCRLTPFDGSSPGSRRSAGAVYGRFLVPDGRWMYSPPIPAAVPHLAQRAPDGTPEQVPQAWPRKRHRIRADGSSFHVDRYEPEHRVVHDAREIDRSRRKGTASSIHLSRRESLLLVRAGGAHNLVTESSGSRTWNQDSAAVAARLSDAALCLQRRPARRVVVADVTGHSPVWLAALNGRSAPRQVTAKTLESVLAAANDVVSGRRQRAKSCIASRDGMNYRRCAHRLQRHVLCFPDGNGWSRIIRPTKRRTE